MRKFPKRLQKKYVQRVRDGLKKGTPSPFYMKRVQLFVQWYLDRHYLTVFRPWWYEELENRKQFDFVETHRKYYEQTFEELGKKTGIDMSQFRDYLKENPKSRKTKWKPRKEKHVQVRKLRNPQQFELKMWNGVIEYKETVLGEIAFSCRGYEFFIHRHGNHWRVSDVVFGRLVTSHDKYKRAIEIAREKIEKNIESYIEQVNKRLVS